MFVLEKFRSYLLGKNIMMHNDHATLRYIMVEKDTMLGLILWIILMPDQRWKMDEIQVEYHLSCLEEEATLKLGNIIKIDNTF